MAQEAQAINAQVRVVNFPGVGHHIRFAAHREYLQSVQSFLKQVLG